jgi:para-nitrobenzyl esterase
LLVAIASDHLYRLNTVEGAEAMARRAGAPVYLYRFDWASPAMNGWLRTPHTADIPFIFGHAALATALTGGRMDALTMQHTLQQAWLRFARHGDPNGGMLPPWPALTPGRRETLLFDLGHCRMAEGPDDADLHTMAGLRRFVPGNAMSFRAD